MDAGERRACTARRCQSRVVAASCDVGLERNRADGSYNDIATRVSFVKPTEIVGPTRHYNAR